MNLRTKLPFFTSIILFFSIATVSILSIYQFQREIKKNIEDYRVEATDQILEHLEDIVDIAYSMIDNTYKLSTPQTIEEKYGMVIQDTSQYVIRMFALNMMKVTLGNLRVLRFGADGYIWINEFEAPYPVVMHAIKPELEGKSWVFYVENTDQNVYEAFHDSIVAGQGAGRVTYNFYKPGTNERIPKISWVRLYEPLGWVIGTGVYVDYIDKIVALKEASLQEQIKQLISTVSIIGIIFIISSIIILTLFARTITDPLYQIQLQLYEMSQGKIVEKLAIKRKDEIGAMKSSLDDLIDGIARYSEFAAEIGKANFEAQFERLSSKDVLGNSLIEMRDSLSSARKQEQDRLFLERKQQWINEGINRMSDIITISQDIKPLSENLIIRLVEYTDAIQGNVFILDFDEDNNAFLNLEAAVAYNVKKHANKQIELGEGLVGACFFEKAPINLTDIPDNYMTVTTGIGAANPKNIYITPLKFENKVFGVIEIASFSIFDKYTIQLIEDVVKLFAVSLSTKEQFSKKFLT
ncbi:MAG: cache domain-containing protein [Bacteroidales bacterium]|nr:cache domain-containing protein [Bacteroidales bacterium]